jgi:hypothetical protein
LRLVRLTNLQIALSDIATPSLPATTPAGRLT